MKFLISLAALVSVTLAQNAGIGYPATGQELDAGSETVVQVQRPVCAKDIRVFIFHEFNEFCF